MSDKNNFEEVIRTISSYVEEILGHEPDRIDNLGEESNERIVLDVPLSGWNGDFYISCHPDEQSFSICYHYDLVTSIANKIHNPDKEQEDDDSFQESIEEALDLVNSIEREHERDILYQISELVQQHPVGIQTADTEEDVFKAFLVYANLFPYEPDFTLTTFNRDVMTVLNAGSLTETFLNYSFNLGIEQDIEPTDEIPSEPNYPGR
ncbi:hypothetical protein ACFQDG_10880 [Natronoarchaeum mannanilyticum]|uniref:Uncharacterized protein n=1 Tax=Natronoarchaeum mannanilyticum TaxID=926360 RepID=A0AAV3T6Q0_9EURY